MVNKITLLDTVTGDEVVAETDRPAFYWTEGNGNCDCNRERRFGRDTVSNHCIGSERYLIVESTYEDCTLEELNDGYPEELVQRYLAAMRTVDRFAEMIINGSPDGIEPVGILGVSKEPVGE